MYKIYLDNYPIYDSRDKEYIVENPRLDLEINKVGTLKFKIYPEHPYFDNIEKLSSVLTVLKGDKVIFKSRVVSDEQGLYNEKNIECEGVLGYLNDSIVRPYSFSGTPAEHFTNLINNHNSQVAEHQQLKIGNITVTDANDYIIRSSVKYDTTWKILNEDLIDKLGGYLRIRYEEDGIYIDYLADFEDTSTQIIELGKNLIDLLVKNDAANVCTVVIPLGAEIENEDGTKTRLTIESVNDGKDYIINQDAFEKYGWIVAPVENTTWNDVTLASNLKTKGTTHLNNDLVMLKSSIEVKAVDLNVTDANIEAFFIYEYVRFISKAHNINQIYLLNKISIPLTEPEKTEITLGKEESSLTGIQLGTGSKIDNVINRVGKIEKEYIINEDVEEIVNNIVPEIVDESILNSTSITQTAEEIVLTALQEYVKTSNFEEFKETVSTMITQTNEDITFNFNTLTSIVSTMDQEIQQQFQEQSKYIRFDGGISLGELGNEVTLRIENDVIKFVVSNTSVLEITPNGIVAPKIKTKEVEYTPFRLYVEEDGSLTLDLVGDNS